MPPCFREGGRGGAQAALHPTPAVCGRPRGDAAGLLRRAERFDRGFYAGPFGWMSAGAAEFAVAIRSALLHAPPPPPGAYAAGSADATSNAVGGSWGDGSDGAPGSNGSGNGAFQRGAPTPGGERVRGEHQRRISLFAGVGIVNGSQPDSEWAELELKVRPATLDVQQQPPMHGMRCDSTCCDSAVEHCGCSGPFCDRCVGHTRNLPRTDGVVLVTCQVVLATCHVDQHDRRRSRCHREGAECRRGSPVILWSSRSSHQWCPERTPATVACKS